MGTFTMKDNPDIRRLLSSPQSEDDTRFDVMLLDEDSWKDDDQKGAVLKTSFIIPGSNLGGDEEHGMRVIQKDLSKDALTVQCDLPQITHGTMSDGGAPATLIVFQFAFMPRDNRKRFKKATITIRFSDGEVTNITPDGSWATFQSETQQELSHSVNPTLEAGIEIAKATVGYTWQLKKNTTIEGHSTVLGCTQTLGQSSSTRKARKNAILWVLQENPQTKSGIPSFMQAAALLKREGTTADPMGHMFSAEITIRGEVETHNLVTDKLENLKKMFGNRKRGQNIFFDPNRNRGVFDNVDDLGEVNLDTYKQLVTIRPWVDGNGKATDQVLVPPEVTQDEFAAQPLPQLPGTEPVAVSTAQGIIAASPSVEDGTGEITSHLSAGNSDERLYRSRMKTDALMLANSTSASSISEDDGVEDRVTSLNTDEKRQKLEDLEEELLLVRNETRLVTQLFMLGREEGRLLKEKRKLR
ncbi:uncharacterized protein Triagg1_1228 [Trichoderma aggressivum f. europaeum]|uniref:Uncharacterized protein n=1 Tax=Trichoderma aggressivum f. europaeum TaxID=173218 RepID=A0AAE1IKG4_9HYPO|nr:hypothetical protein Triagg1_1228 [Trichoderma aggressivum f. europaeum]